MKYVAYSILFFTSLSASAADFVALSAEQRAAFAIGTVTAQAAGEAQSKPFPAKVTVPNAQLRVVGAPLDGVVESLLVAEGEAVEAGQPLAHIRSPQLLELQSVYLETRTRLGLADETLARERKLSKEGIVAKRRLLESRANQRELETAAARYRQALLLAGMDEEAIGRLEREQQLSATLDLVSPLAGVVLEQIGTAGQRVSAADPLYRIGDLSLLWLEVHVPLELLGDTKPDSRVRVAEPALEARVITVGRMVHGTDQGVLVRAEVRDGVQLLRPGQFVEARLSGDTGAGAVRLPDRAVVRNAGLEYVFVARDGGFDAVAVVIASRGGGQVVLRSGPAAGEQVVVSGTAALKAAWLGGGE